MQKYVSVFRTPSEQSFYVLRKGMIINDKRKQERVDRV